MNLSSHILTFKKDQYIFKEGEKSSEMYFVHSGKVQIEKTIDKKSQTLAILEKGDFFGEMSLLDDEPRSANALAIEDCKLLKIDAVAFEKLIQSNVEIAIRIMRKYALRLRQANATIASLMNKTEQDDARTKTVLKPHKLATLTLLSNKTDFDVLQPDVLIGRFDPVTNIRPDIDLTLHDVKKSTSRRHARIKLDVDGFKVKEEVGVTNGSKLNGKKIEAGVWAKLNHGDVIEFGSLEFLFKEVNA